MSDGRSQFSKKIPVGIVLGPVKIEKIFQQLRVRNKHGVKLFADHAGGGAFVGQEFAIL
jgi:hypothetical protein